MRKIIKIKNGKKIVFIAIFLVVFLLQLMAAPSVFAAETAVGKFINIATKAVSAPFVGGLALVVNVLIWLVGQISTLMIAILFVIMEYNGFIHEPIVSEGWIVVRDLCNMFFILILLIIAFATILRVESYNWKKMLPKLLIMAVLINFSKTISGVFIDFAQVIMLTFASAYNVGGNFIGHGALVNALGLQKLFSIRDVAAGVTDYFLDDSVTVLSTIGTMLFSLIMLVIATIVIGVFAIILLFRVIFLWILIILSPFAYLLSAFPAGQKYASQWWDNFTKQVIIGPVMAFFLWLALRVSQIGNGVTGGNLEKGFDATTGGAWSATGDFSATLSAFGDISTMLQYLMTIMFLIGGMIAAQQIGGIAGSVASRGMAAIQRGRGFVTSLPGRGARGAAGMGLSWLSQGDDPNPATGTAGSRRSRFRERLGALGATNLPGINTLATNALTGLGAMQRSQEEAAQRYVGNIKDTRILRRIANKGALGTLTPWQNAIRDAARDKAPSFVEADTQGNYNGMSRKQLQTLSRNEWRRLGVLHGAGTLDLNANPDAIHVIQQDSVLRGAVNSGIGVDTYFGTQRDGTAFTGPAGNGGTPGPQMAAPRNPLAYRMAETGENSGGNLSVNRFGKGKDNTIAVDFNELGLDFLKGKNGDIKGFNAMDQDHISKIAEKMVGVIDKELAKLESGSRTAGDEKRMANMQAARERFMDPGKIGNLSLVNSSANGYGLNDAKETKIHEEIHGFGVRGEEPTEMITKKTMNTKQYSKRKEMALEEIIDTEEKEEKAVNNFGSRQDGNSPEVKTIIEHIHSGNVNSPQAMKDLVFYMKQLNKTMTNNTGALGKFKNILNNADSNKMSPLEVKVIADKIKKSVK